MAAGYLETEGVLPRSNMNRLLSSEELRGLVGLSFADGKLSFTASPEKVLAALDRIASDLITKKLVLGHIWNNGGKRNYLSELHSGGVLPEKRDRLSAPIAFEEVTPPKRAPLRNKPAILEPRSTLIPTDCDPALSWSTETARLQEIWRELQQLSIERYPNAVAVSLRVLLELAVDQHISSNRALGVTEDDKLRRKVERVAVHLEEIGVISEKYKREILKFASGEELISTAALHRYIHSLTYAPSPRHLIAIWDTLSEFLFNCLKANGDRKKAA